MPLDVQAVIGMLSQGELLPRIYEHARRCYPRECCGMIHRSGTLRLCENAIDRMHAEDPGAFPRTSANGYCFDFADLFHLSSSLDSADPVSVVFHSHPDGAAEFSRADHEAAMFEGTAVYPTILHLVIAVVRGQVGESRLFIPADGHYRVAARFGGQSLPRTAADRPRWGWVAIHVANA